MIAHHHRAISGEGQWVDTSAQHACVWPTMDSRIMWEIFRKNQERAGGNRWRTMPKGVLNMRLLYPCRDGFVQLYIWGGKLGEGSNKALDAWMREEGMDTSPLKKYGWPALEMTQVAPGEYDEMTGLVAQFIRPRAKVELYEGAVQRGIMMAPVSTFQDVWQNRQLEARGFWVDVSHEELPDTLRYPGRWALLTETPLNRWNRAPRIGEHNPEIYRGELKMTQGDMEHLVKLGVI
jgi:crotonobetainyl-CoA:carnitine CoA-transferase CaiB-like acyl-CoA transferase